MQTLNDKKTISRLSNKIKELEIVSEAFQDGHIIDERNKQISKLEKEIASLEASIESKDLQITELEQTLSDLQTKHDNTIQEKQESENKHIEESTQYQMNIKNLENENLSLKDDIEKKEKLHSTFQKKIETLLDEKQEYIDKIEVIEKKENELTEIVEQSNSKTDKKDKIYAKMLKNKEKKLNKMTSQVEKLENAEKSREQTIEYFKNKIQVLEKQKECERCKAYAKKKYYQENNLADYDTDFNNQSEKFSELLENENGKLSPKAGSMIDLDGEEEEEINIKPNHVEKISLALQNSLKDNVKKLEKLQTKSVKSDENESISMKDEFDTYSDTFNDKVKHEIEILQNDLKKLRIEYDEISQQNLDYKKSISEKEEQIQNLDNQVLKIHKEKTELLIKNNNQEKEISNLEKRRNAAKMEIISLNKKLDKISSKMSDSNIPGSNREYEKAEDAKSEHAHELQLEAEKNFSRSLRILTRLKKRIENIYKEYINLLIHAEETNSSAKKLVYHIEKEINGLKISINEYFDDVTISKNIAKVESKSNVSRGSILSEQH